jgi:hypothetical protein
MSKQVAISRKVISRDGKVNMADQPGTQLFVRSRSVVSRLVAGETLIVPIRGKVGDLASIYSFNGAGSLIWKLLESPVARTELIEALEHEYEVSREEASRDVAEFLNELLSVGLVETRTSVQERSAESYGQLVADVVGG